MYVRRIKGNQQKTAFIDGKGIGKAKEITGAFFVVCFLSFVLKLGSKYSHFESLTKDKKK